MPIEEYTSLNDEVSVEMPQEISDWMDAVINTPTDHDMPPDISRWVNSETASMYSHPSRATSLNYPQVWRTYGIDDLNDVRYMQDPTRLMPYTEIRVNYTTSKLIHIRIPRDNRQWSGYKPSAIDDFYFKLNLFNRMLHSYFERGEGRGLNVDRPRDYFCTAERTVDIEGDIYLVNSPNYFNDIEVVNRTTRNERPASKVFVKSLKYIRRDGLLFERVVIELETCFYTYLNNHGTVEEDPYDILNKRQQFKNNLIVSVDSRARPIKRVPDNEQVAIETLREIITEAEYRKYVTHGFILVKGRSGRVYQIFRDKDHTKVWEKGQLVEEVCVRLERGSGVPLTDNVIAFRTMVLYSENEFRKLGNVYNMIKRAA